MLVLPKHRSQLQGIPRQSKSKFVTVASPKWVIIAIILLQSDRADRRAEFSATSMWPRVQVNAQ